MKNTCECGHPSRVICEGHTIDNCEFKYRRKLLAKKNILLCSRKYLSEYRDYLWSIPKGMFKPEFHFLIGVEQILHYLEDQLNHDLKNSGLGAIKRSERCNCCEVS